MQGCKEAVAWLKRCEGREVEDLLKGVTETWKIGIAVHFHFHLHFAIFSDLSHPLHSVTHLHHLDLSDTPYPFNNPSPGTAHMRNTPHTLSRQRIGQDWESGNSIGFADAFIDQTSFSRTVEVLYNASHLIKEGYVACVIECRAL